MNKIFFVTLTTLLLLFSSPALSIDSPAKATTEQENTLIDIIDKTSPSVITIEIEKNNLPQKQSSLEFFDFFTDFLHIPSSFLNVQNGQDDTQYNIGSGFIVSSDGIIVTSKHVVSEIKAKYRIVTQDNKKYDVSSIYRDPAKEIAVLRVKGNGLKAIKLGDSDKIKIGQTAVAMGTALGELPNTATIGIISGRSRKISVKSDTNRDITLNDMIQTDAAINFGISGGPLLNSSGEVIGINTITTVFGENIGFALPINAVKKILNDQFKLKL